MKDGSVVLCPVDFSESSAGALRYASLIARHAGAKLVVLAVEDPRLTEAAGLGTGILWSADDCSAEMEKFAARALGPEPGMGNALEYTVAVGRPATEILRVARERSAALMVISTHGLTGVRKLFFGSTTERVLREAPCPVLVTSGTSPGHISVADLKGVIGRILVPVDLSPASLAQAEAVIRMLRALVEHFAAVPSLLPDPQVAPVEAGPGSPEAFRAAVTYVGGMTDRFACDQAVARLGWPTGQLPRGVDLAG